MKIAIVSPPLESRKGTPLISQNRQFQWFKSPTYIYPIIPASAATMLKKAGYKVFWLDGVAEKWTYREWMSRVDKIKPDLIMIETKTPVIKRHWEIIDDLKNNSDWNPKIILVGDHVTALPEESMKNSRVDYILAGGNYDFLLLNLVNHIEKGAEMKPGIWYREGPKVKNTGRFKLDDSLDRIPFIDRDLTKWDLYAYKNGNFKRTPGTYIMAGRDCWWRRDGGCSFCAWTVLYPKFTIRSVENVLDEIGELIETYGVKEIFDDTGTFMVGGWLKEFCRGMISRGYNQKIYFGCNMRFGVLKRDDYRLMAEAGFRFLLYGLESANQETLDKLGKGTNVNKIEEELICIKEVNKEIGGNLEPHVTCMVGYPWETYEDAKSTVDLTKRFFEKGFISSLQATIVIPYPGTRLFEQCTKNGWLKIEDWDRYDMKEPVMKTPLTDDQILHLTRGIYTTFLTPKFIFKKLAGIRSLEDVSFLIRGARQVAGHLFDFK